MEFIKTFSSALSAPSAVKTGFSGWSFFEDLTKVQADVRQREKPHPFRCAEDVSLAIESVGAQEEALNAP